MLKLITVWCVPLLWTAGLVNLAVADLTLSAIKEARNRDPPRALATAKKGMCSWGVDLLTGPTWPRTGRDHTTRITPALLCTCKQASANENKRQNFQISNENKWQLWVAGAKNRAPFCCYTLGNSTVQRECQQLPYTLLKVCDALQHFLKIEGNQTWPPALWILAISSGLSGLWSNVSRLPIKDPSKLCHFAISLKRPKNTRADGWE